ncbi:MAG: SDR family NAD(P)-dependent oxidoreductase [Bacteroidota bacterium]
MKSEKKTAIVTGSSSGVGAATCIELARRGWNVVINYALSEKEAHEVAEKCKAFTDGVMVIKADVSQDDQGISMVNEAINKWGRLDALVNNAGTTRYCNYKNLDGLSKEDFLKLYEVNVVGAYQVTRAAAKYLKEAKGSVVNTSSISAISGVGSSIAYAASKGALSTMTLSLAHALAPDVRVNAVCPGFIQGRWTKNFLGERYDQVRKDIEKTTLLQSSSTPEDIAKAIVYLAADAGTTTGQLLTIDSGQLVNQNIL